MSHLFIPAPRTLGTFAVLAVMIALMAAPAGAVTYAPVNQPGPALDVPAAKLAQSLRCTDNLASAGREPVLFVPPTLVNPDEAFFPYEQALSTMGVPYCTVTVPDYTTGDIQVSAEYTVFGVRRMHALSGLRVQIIGWSQGGGPEPRWALRFWPDIRPLVSKLIDIEGPNHGALILHFACSGTAPNQKCTSPLCPGHCPPSLYQQADDSIFTAALNSGQETFPGIAYTNIYSHTSDFVQPNLNGSGTTSLHGGGGQIANIALQDICPADTAGHMDYYYDPVGWAIVMDALSHPGPADPRRIRPSVCSQSTNPYVSPTETPAYNTYAFDALFLNRISQEPQATHEPALSCYVTASCPAPSRHQADRPKRHRRRQRK
jgi:hypothetical protein